MSLVQKIGENIVLRKVVKLSGNISEFYIHSNKKIASGVSLKKGNEEIAKEIAMHVAASNPLVLSPEHLGEDYIQKEREIFKSQVEQENKPPEILEKMIEGKLNKQLSDVSRKKGFCLENASSLLLKTFEKVVETFNIVLGGGKLKIIYLKQMQK